MNKLAYTAIFISLLFTFAVALNPTFNIFGSRFIDTNLANSFGTFIGGVLSPFLSIISIVLLIMSIKMQTTEARKNDIKTHIYELLKYNRDSVSELEYQPSNESQKQVQTGSRFFIYAKRQIEEAVADVRLTSPSLTCVDAYQIAYLIFYFGTSLETKETLKKHLAGIIGDADAEKLINGIRDKRAKYDKATQYYGGNQNRLGCYFRQLYYLIKSIDTETLFDDAEKQRYIKMIRVQLGDYEQALLFYNSLTTLGSPWASKSTQEQSLIVRYELIKNIQDGFLEFKNFKAVYPEINYE